MKFIIVFTLICILIASSKAASFRGSSRHEEKSGWCLVDGIALAPGTDAPLQSRCGRISCVGNGYYNVDTCGIQGLPEGYTLGDPVTPNAAYPDCCERQIINIVDENTI